MPLTKEEEQNWLLEQARLVAKNAYAPYSNFKVAAIVKTKDGKYSCACSVTVISEQDKEFTPLAYFVKVFKYEGANAV